MDHLSLYTDPILLKATLNDLQEAKEQLLSERADFPGKIADLAARGGGRPGRDRHGGLSLHVPASLRNRTRRAASMGRHPTDGVPSPGRR